MLGTLFTAKTSPSVPLLLSSVPELLISASILVSSSYSSWFSSTSAISSSLSIPPELSNSPRISTAAQSVLSLFHRLGGLGKQSQLPADSPLVSAPSSSQDRFPRKLRRDVCLRDEVSAILTHRSCRCGPD